MYMYISTFLQFFKKFLTHIKYTFFLKSVNIAVGSIDIEIVLVNCYNHGQF